MYNPVAQVTFWARNILVPVAHNVAQDQELQNGTKLCSSISQPPSYICYWPGKATGETKNKYSIIYCPGNL